MAKLKLGPIVDARAIRVTMDIPASLHRDLAAYADALGREQGRPIADPVKLIVPMLERFMATDRGFARIRKAMAARHDRNQASDQSGST
jgi:hypothetical protein